MAAKEKRERNLLWQRRYLDGESPEKIAKENGVQVNAVYLILRKLKTPMRNPGRPSIDSDLCCWVNLAIIVDGDTFYFDSENMTEDMADKLTVKLLKAGYKATSMEK